MENYFEKYAEHVKLLQAEITRLEQELAAARSNTRYDSGRIKGRNIFSQYYYFTAEMMRQRGVNNFFSPATYLRLLSKVIVLPVKTSVLAGSALHRRVIRPYFSYYFSQLIYEARVYMRNGLFKRKRQKGFYRVGIFIPTLQALGGAEKYAISIAQSLQQNFKNLEIEMIVTNIFSDRPSLYDIPTKQEIYEKFQSQLPHVKFRYEILNYHDEYHIWNKNFKRVNKISQRYDLFINCQHNIYHPTSKKSLFVCHFPHRPMEQINLQIPGFEKSQLKRMYTRSYDGYVSNSSFTESWMNKYWPDIGKTKREVLCPPVLPDNARCAIPLKKDKVILTCGRLDPEKKALELAKIFILNRKHFEGYEFHIAGTAYHNIPELRDYYMKLQQLANSHSFIHLHIDLTQAQLFDLYRRASIYWHGMGFLEDIETNPIRTEHFGITIVEAMSQGCIPVVHRSGGAYQVTRAAGLQTDWATEQEAVSIISQLIKTKDLTHLRSRMIEASLLYSEEAFDRQFVQIARKRRLIPEKHFK